MSQGGPHVSTDDDVIRIRLTVAGGRALVWSLLTEAAHIARWWGEYVAFEPGPDGQLVERWRDGDREVVTRGSVTEWRPPSALAMTWADDGWPAGTRLRICLSGEGDRTDLALDHDGWAAFPNADRQALIRAHADGWSHHMASLSAYAAKQSP